MAKARKQGKRAGRSLPARDMAMDIPESASSLLERFFEENEVGMDRIWHRDDALEDLDFFNIVGWHEMHLAVPDLSLAAGASGSMLHRTFARPVRMDETYSSLAWLTLVRGSFRYDIPGDE
jgi:hypothetical protein